MENNEQKSTEQLWKEFLETINKQLERNTRLREIVQPFAETSSGRKGTALTEEIASKVKDLFIEIEALLGEERAIYHTLFGIGE